MFAPSDDTVQSVRSWLLASGIDDSIIVHSENKGWLAFDLPAWQAQDLFQTEYHEHVHAKSGNVRVGCDEFVSTSNPRVIALIRSTLGTLCRSISENTLILFPPVSSSQL